MTAIARSQAAGVGFFEPLGKGLMVFSISAAAVGPLLDEPSRDVLWANAAAILGIVGLMTLTGKLSGSRPLSLARVIIMLGASQPVFLILATVLDGDAGYMTHLGYFRHSEGAWKVAMATVGFNAAVLLGAAPLMLLGRKTSMKVSELFARASSRFMALAGVLVLIHLTIRMLMLFLGSEIGGTWGYFLRLYQTMMQPIFIYLGAALRYRIRLAVPVSVAALAISAFVLLTGSRAIAIYPLLLMAVGYTLAWPMSRSMMLRLVAPGLALFLFAMFLGGVVRGDARGRTAEAAFERLDELEGTVQEGAEAERVSNSSFRRMVSNSTHSIILRIPRDMPYERDGLEKIPADLADRFLPRFNFEGVSSTETPRAFMLNELGFMVNWSTFVEMNLLGDSWYRDGPVGVLVIGLLVGLTFQLVESGLYLAMRREPKFSILLVFILANLIDMTARDYVGAVRALAFELVAGLVVVVIARLLMVPAPDAADSQTGRPALAGNESRT